MAFEIQLTLLLATFVREGERISRVGTTAGGVVSPFWLVCQPRTGSMSGLYYLASSPHSFATTNQIL